MPPFQPSRVGREEEAASWEAHRVRRREHLPRPEPSWGTRLQVRLLRSFAWVGLLFIALPFAAACAALGALAAYLEQAPPIREFEDYDPPEATILHDANGNSYTALYEQRRYVVPLNQLPLELPEAFVAIEDARYRQHFGVDPLGIARAMAVNLTRGRLSQGASTITQQTARNLLPAIGTEKTATRKLHEMLVALRMERHFTKDQILEVYLNQIYLGSGTYGVEAAARTYFDKSARDLTIAEAATLAGLPQLPERYSPLNNPDLALKRRDAVLARMWEQGIITGREFDRATTAELDVRPTRISRSRGPYFVDAVRRVLADAPGLGENRLHTAGWIVHTTVDPVLQSIAEETLREGLDREEAHWLEARQERFARVRNTPEHARPPVVGEPRMAEVMRLFDNHLVVEIPGGWRADVSIPAATARYFREGSSLQPGDGVDIVVKELVSARGLMEADLLPRRRLQGALVCLDVGTGEVRALAGGRAFNDPANGGFFNRAFLARRQAGSTFKPLFHGAALEYGMTPYTIVDDSPVTFPDGYAPRNFGDRYAGRVSLESALAHSRNVATIRMIQEVGLSPALRFVARFQRSGNNPWALPLEWPVVLGTTEVTPLELAAAYQAIANRGHARGPVLIRSVRRPGSPEQTRLDAPQEEVLLGEQAAAYLTQMMQAVMREGTGQRLLEQMPEAMHRRIAGKSGTTNDNRDAWFAGFTPGEVVVVWVGFDQNLPLGPARTGSAAAGPIWADFLSRVWETKTLAERSAPLHLPAGHQWLSREQQQRGTEAGARAQAPPAALPQAVTADAREPRP